MKTQKTKGKVAVGHPVDVATGTLFHDFEDYILPGRVPLIFGRRYSSALTGETEGLFGPGWSSPFDMRIKQDLDGYRMVDADGETVIEFEDLDGIVDAGGIVRDPGSFHEIRRKDNRLVVSRWNPDSYEVVRYVFSMGKQGQWWPLTSREDVEGQGFDLLRDAADRVTGATLRREKRGYRLKHNPDGRVSEVFIASEALEDVDGIRSIRRKERPILWYGYNQNGQLSEFVDALGNRCTYEYDAQGRLVRETNIGGMVYTFRYNAEGKCIETSGLNDFGRNTLEINDTARMTEVADSLGNTTLYEWNEDGQVVRTITPLGNVSGAEYDDEGRVVSQVSAEGAATTYEYDDRGDRIKITSPSGAATAYQFNEDHQVTSVTDPSGHVWRRVYDDAGRVAAVINPLGEKLSYVYDGRGDLLSMIDNAGNRRNFEWDGFGNLARATDWMGNATTYRYDDEGQLIALEDALGNRTRARLDVLGRVVEIRLPDGATRRFEWDPYNQLTRYVDEKGAATQWEYEDCGLLSDVVRPTGGKIRFNWNTEPGQLLSVTNEQGERYRFEYDADGRLVRETDFAGRETGYEYDKDGLVSAIADAAGHRTEIERNPDGAVEKIGHDDGSGVEYEYDERGLLTRADNGVCPVERVYDAVGRLVNEKQGEAEIASAYDDLGNRIRRVSSLDHVTEFLWNANGQIISLAMGGLNPIRFEYDAAWNETARYVDGGVRISHAYDNRMRRTEQQVNRTIGGSVGRVAVGHVPVIQRKYQYDASGNLTDIADRQWGKISYKYDEAGRIIGSRFSAGFEERFRYDATDNIVEQAKSELPDGRIPETRVWEEFGYGPGNLLKHGAGKQYEYDVLGQLVERTDAEGTTRFEWNRSGQLSGVVLPGGERWEYRYDAFGRRVEKQGPCRCVRIVWDGDVVLHEIRSNGNGDSDAEVSHWEFEPDGFAPVAKTDRNRQYLCVNDVAGNPREMVREDGEVVWAALFSTWGEVQESTVSEVDCPVRFQGQWFDEETGLHYNRFRYYDPELGRFVSPDPVALLGGVNGFLYAPNTVRWIDPSGLTIICPKPGSGWTRRRTLELEESIPEAQKGRITMGVGLARDPSTGKMVRLIGTSEPGGYLRPGVTLKRGEILVKGTGHAEVNIVNYAKTNNLELIEIGATRPICANCSAAIDQDSGSPVTPLKKG